jgi:hypothetical protein
VVPEPSGEGAERELEIRIELPGERRGTVERAGGRVADIGRCED